MGRLLVLLAAETTALVGVLRAGSALGPPAPEELYRWLTVVSAEQAIVAAAWLAAVAATAWLLGSTVLYLLVRLWGAPRALRAVSSVTLPAVRRLADRVVAVAVVGAVTCGSLSAGSAPPFVGHGVPAVAARFADPLATEAASPEGAALDPVFHEVRYGDHLWGIARARVSGGVEEASMPAVHAYWTAVVETNRPGLRSGNPDLIYPGEVVRLPPWPSPSSAEDGREASDGTQSLGGQGGGGASGADGWVGRGTPGMGSGGGGGTPGMGSGGGGGTFDADAMSDPRSVPTRLSAPRAGPAPPATMPAVLSPVQPGTGTPPIPPVPPVAWPPVPPPPPVASPPVPPVPPTPAPAPPPAGPIPVPPLPPETVTATPVPTAAYALPVERRLLTTVAMARPHHRYAAWDLALPIGTPVAAVHAGTVLSVTARDSRCGLGVIVAGDDGHRYTYCHADELLIRPGERVGAGQVILRSGNTGRSTGPHLHLEIRAPDGIRLCPQPLLAAWYEGEPRHPGSAPASGCTH